MKCGSILPGAVGRQRGGLAPAILSPGVTISFTKRLFTDRQIAMIKTSSVIAGSADRMFSYESHDSRSPEISPSDYLLAVKSRQVVAIIIASVTPLKGPVSHLPASYLLCFLYGYEYRRH